MLFNVFPTWAVHQLHAFIRLSVGILFFESPSTTFGQARLYIHNLKLKHRKAWREWQEAGKRPAFIPENPDEVYLGKEWFDWYDWVGY
jgi:hypothetical protein